MEAQFKEWDLWRGQYEHRKTQSKGERLMSEHAGRGSWCNAEGIAMETNGGKEQTRRRRRGLNRKEEITASYCGGGCFHERGGAGRQTSNKCGNGVK